MKELKKINKIFNEHGINARAISFNREGVFLIFNIILNSGGKLKDIERHLTEIALALKAQAQPLVYPVMSKGIVKMEVMVSSPKTVFWQEIMGEVKIPLSYKLPLVLGEFGNGDPVIVDLSKMPHLLIGGSTGSGKSICLHSIINSLTLNCNNVLFSLIDLKRVEFSSYKDRSNLFSPIAQSSQEAIYVLTNLVEEMESRFKKLEKMGYRDISQAKNMPYIVVIIDEFADLMLSSRKIIQGLVCRLAQKSRAAGIHLILATQRPSADIITGLIKANFPAKISCKVSSAINSRILLDKNGAEKLLGEGDAIIDCSEYQFKRFKGAYISSEIIKEISSKYKLKKSFWSKVWIS